MLLIIALVASILLGVMIYAQDKRVYEEYRLSSANDSVTFRYHAPPDLGGAVFVSFVVGIVSVAIVGLIAVAHGTIAGREEVWTTKLVAMDDSTNTNGTFSVFGGTIDEDPVYYFYYESQPGVYKRGFVFADESEIRYTNGAPRIERTYKFTSRWILPIEARQQSGPNRISVPEGSIKTEFEFDNKNA